VREDISQYAEHEERRKALLKETRAAWDEFQTVSQYATILAAVATSPAIALKLRP